MNALALALLTAAAGALQATAPTAAWLGGVRAPLLLALALHYALTRPPGFALGAALLAGLVQDALGGAPAGCSPLAFGAAALLAGRHRGAVFHAAPLTRAAFGAAAAAGVTAALWAMLAAAGAVALSPGQGALRLAGAAALGALVTPVVGRVAGGVDEALGLAPAGRG